MLFVGLSEFCLRGAASVLSVLLAPCEFGQSLNLANYVYGLAGLDKTYESLSGLRNGLPYTLVSITSRSDLGMQGEFAVLLSLSKHGPQPGSQYFVIYNIITLM
jgi:hypothetical protein